VRLLVALLVLVLLLAAAVAVLWPLTPAVDDAEHRVALRLAEHGGRDLRALPRPDRVGEAVVATEDRRFYRHHGLDVLGVTRATYEWLRGAGDPGGATLDQQLAKNLYTPGETGPTSKLEQVELSFKLEARYSKAHILEMYLSAVYFGHGYYGLPSAAHGYFGVEPSHLTWAQASMLAGLLQAPSAYEPHAHLARARHRQRHVLDRLVATHVLTATQADAAFAAPLHLR